MRPAEVRQSDYELRRTGVSMLYKVSSLGRQNACELPRHSAAHGPKFGVKLVSKYADWAGFAGSAVC